ncbi:MAG: restriction endonuclease subunit S [Candidatus Margulisbacteria bacterium]|nr:restriction endonuclease subunit S [Candidatus Margulisiibacteriota bacterium]
MASKVNQRIPKGDRRAKVGVIPDDWEVKGLDELGECIIGLTYSPSNIVDYGLLVLRASNIYNGKVAYEDNVYVNCDVPQRKRVRKNDLLICVRSGSRELIGKCALIDDRTEGMAFGAFMTIFRSSYGPFVFQQFQSHNIKKQIEEHLGATINQITNKSLQSFKIPFPPDEKERTIITAILSDADMLIESLEKLIAKKRAIKQGAMQALLTGKRRLLGFSGEWQVEELGEIVEITKGQLITENTCIPGDIPVIAGGKTPAYYHNKPNRWGSTITVSASGANAGFVAFYNYPIFASDCSTIEEGGKYSVKYIYYQLLLNQSKIYKIQTGGAQPHIHPSDLYPLQIPRPEKQEQMAIADILSDMDAEIDALGLTLSKYKMIKISMMQNLLTGKIRVYGTHN